MILEQPSGGIPFNFDSSSNTTCFTILIEFWQIQKQKPKKAIYKKLNYSTKKMKELFMSEVDIIEGGFYAGVSGKPHYYLLGTLWRSI